MKDRKGARGAIDDAGFDRALRAIHAEAVSNVSPRTRVQLRHRLRSAIRLAPSRPHEWPMASAFIALVLVAGAYWRMTALPDAPSPAAVGDTGADVDLVAVIDETPDLYLWLDSDEATRLASE